MHELSIAYDIYATARRAALEHHADQVNKICVEIGEMAMVNPEQVQFLFQTIIEEDPIFAEAHLECSVGEVHSRCKCGYEGNERFVCPRCGSLPELIRGREIVVINIEIEVEEE
ncbi:MAG TPA: hydrogenase maturation nickel metallochaperone HypA [Methanoregulaceae archaeon]|nr:hydrogenase maturation nickel metallochaperone HypA [Methanoregulaceae archaeon]